jgi:outer membrane protein TolC
VDPRLATRLLIGLLVAVPSAARSDVPLSLDAAIREASVANARLPLARFDIASSRTFVPEARSDLFPTFSIAGSARDARPGTYDQNLEVFARGPLYDASIRPRIRVAHANIAAALARYRMTEADLELEVRTRFSDAIEAQAEVAIQREAIARLTSYVDTIKLRQVAGEGVEADLLNGQAALATQDAALLDAELRVEDDRLQLNDLLGRDPIAPLVLAPPPMPAAVAPATSATPWIRTPDVSVVAAEALAARESIAVARAEHRPNVTYELGAGLIGVQSAQDPNESYASRILRGFGVSATLSLNWTLFDFGGYRARTHRAEINRDIALANETVIVRAARLAFEQARLDLETLLRAVDLNARAVSATRDAYLAAESVYRGGSGTALAVIDAHRIWVSTAITNANVQLRYRLAEANYIRRGGR